MERVLIPIVILTLFAWGWAVIFKKAGYSATMSLLMLIPLVNVFTFIYFASAEWPIFSEFSKRGSGDEWDRPPQDRIDTMLRQAAAFEQRGDWNEAARLFDILAEELRGQAGSAFAAHSAKRVRERHLLAD